MQLEYERSLYVSRPCASGGAAAQEIKQCNHPTFEPVLDGQCDGRPMALLKLIKELY